jgi:hypothetical protein
MMAYIEFAGCITLHLLDYPRFAWSHDVTGPKLLRCRVQFLSLPFPQGLLKYVMCYITSKVVGHVKRTINIRPSSLAAILAHLPTRDIADGNSDSMLLIRLENATRASSKPCSQNGVVAIGARWT